MNGMKTEGN